MNSFTNLEPMVTHYIGHSEAANALREMCVTGDPDGGRTVPV